MNTAITVRQGDITEATTNAIVNAANSAMLGGGGVDGAIHRAAGPELLEHCRRIAVVNSIRCPVGEARITPAGNLQSQWVIHTVGPRYEIDPEPKKLLQSAYRSALTLAQEYNCRSVAFPAISCGVYGYPHTEAAQISLAVCRESQWSKMKIVFYLFSAEMVDTWRQAMAPGA